MKNKLFILTLLFSSLLFPAFTQEATAEEKTTDKTSFVNFFTPEVEHTATVELQVNNYNNLYTFTLGTSAMVKADMKELTVTNGFEFYHSGFSLTNDTTYAPTLFNVLNVGGRMIHHYTFSYKTYFEYDFLAGLYVKYQPLPCLYFSASVLYQQKNSHIYELQDSSCPKIVSNCPAFDVMADYKPLEWLDITLSLSSFTFTKYNLFFSPNTRINAEFKVNPFLYIGIGGEIQFVDFFTLSANFNRLSCDVNISWRF